jgi:hypothetical protein
MPRSRERCRTQATGNPGGATSNRNQASSGAAASEVVVSAVISTYLLTHLHHVLQRAEYGAQQEGRTGLAANYAQLRQVLCLDARSLDEAAPDTPQAA